MARAPAAAVLTMLLNPTRLRRIYDNESLVDREQDTRRLDMEAVTPVSGICG
jgi:hypothetical protein